MSVTAASASDQAGASSISCPYCAADIPTSDFGVWFNQPRLATGRCPGCERDITVPVQWLSTPVTIRLPDQARKS